MELGVSGAFEYRGIQYSAEPAGARRWRWRVSPPDCVRGLRPEAGEIDGACGDAIQAARAAIKNQGHHADGHPE
jgi:hypothetical protein